MSTGTNPDTGRPGVREAAAVQTYYQPLPAYLSRRDQIACEMMKDLGMPPHEFSTFDEQAAEAVMLADALIE